MAVTVKNTFIQMAADEADEEELCQAIDFKRQQSEPAPKALVAESFQDNSIASRSVACEILEEIVDESPQRGISRETIAVSYDGEQVDPNLSSGSDDSWQDDDLEMTEVPWTRLVTHDGLEPLSPSVTELKKPAKITLSLASAITEQAVVEEPSDEDGDDDDNNGSEPHQRTGIVQTMIPYPAFLQARQNLAEVVGPEKTLMIRNVPNKYSRDSFIGELHETGFQGAFDFLYLPIDPDTRANKGYAFVNFVNAQFAKVFTTMFQNRKMTRFDSDKRISVTPAVLQGFAANYAHYSKKYISQQDESMRPLFLRALKANAVPANRPVPTMPPVKNASSRRGNRTSLIDKATRQQTGYQVGCTGKRITGSHPNVLVQRFPAQEKKIQTQEFKFCVHCGTKVLASFRFCQSCGQSIPH